VSSVLPSGSSIISPSAVRISFACCGDVVYMRAYDDGYNGDAHPITSGGGRLHTKANKRAGEAVLR
jgi:hypothetical protein